MSDGRRGGRIALALALVGLLLTGGTAGRAQQATKPVVLLAAIDGAIGPATVRHVEKVLAAAERQQAEAVVLRLDTPGGLVTSMREIVSAILASPVPVIGYVAPPGAHAASAGTYILYATPLAAMAPGTNLGAATPIQLGGGLPGLPSDDGGSKDAKQVRRAEPATAHERKALNDAIAFIRSLAELHGRNADWAEAAVRDAASLSAKEALANGVVELIASNVGSLLAQADGRTVTVAGKTRTIATRDAAVETIDVDAVTRLLGVLSDPNVALILMMIGVYGLIFEFAHPGAVAPGVAGVICLTLGLYALQQLPLDYAGLGLLLFGIALMVAEAVTPAFGALGVGGMIALVLGGAMLIDTDAPAFRLSWWTIGGVAVVSAGLLVLVLGHVWRTYRRRSPAAVAVAGHGMLGLAAEVADWSGTEGHVWARGERWQARAVDPGTTAALRTGVSVRVRAVDGLVLTVEPAENRLDHNGGC